MHASEQLGTAHAVLQAEKDLGGKDGMTLVVSGGYTIIYR